MVSFESKPRRFSIAEFVLITRLPCVNDLDKSRFKIGDNSFKDKYLTREATVAKFTLEKYFMFADFKNDQDDLNFAILYLINNFLFFKDKEKLVKDIDV